MSTTPFSQIFPTATGNAVKTVEAHREPQDLMFYASWFCPFAQRTWITLEERGIPYQFKEINPYKKEKHFLEINPKGLVPAIVYKGKPVYESLILCEFLEDEFPSYEPKLLPANPLERAYARIWIDFVTKSVVPHQMRLIQAQAEDKRAVALADLTKGLRTFAEQIKGPYFLGDQFSLVDVAIAPFVVRDYIITENRGFDRAVVGGGWKEYADNLVKRESLVKTTSDKDKYTPIYDRYLKDEAQSEAAKAIREGRPIP